MMWKEYELGDTVLKANKDMTLWETENGIVSISKNTLVIPLKRGDKLGGCMFQGNGKLLLDTIVETERGAVGKPVEKELNKPFLMLGDVEKIQQQLRPATKEDLSKIGYVHEQEFKTKAQELCKRFLRNAHWCPCNNLVNGHVFIFLNETDKREILLAKDSSIVYKSADTVFLSSKNRVILKTPNCCVLSRQKGALTVKKMCL
ncbi:MAG: hypothetical protein ACUVT5_01855 [Candidatus Bathyarchaeales archaeon]